MKRLSYEICRVIVEEFGSEELLRRLSNPFFFQSFACVVGFDWHSSGTTTTLCGALRECGLERIGIYVCGGKGAKALKTTEEIERKAKVAGVESERMKYLSRITAKIDNCCVQDGFTLYHHTFIFDENGNWCVVQQGMNEEKRYARRYHWFNAENLTIDPHAAICSDLRNLKVLNLVSKENKELQKCILDIVNEGAFERLYMRPEHWFDVRKYMHCFERLKEAYEMQPKSFEELLGIRGIGFKSLRALALVAKVIYGCEISWKDPAMFSFAHGGKDGVPFPVDRETYEETIEFLRSAVEESRVDDRSKLRALKVLAKFI